MTRTYFFNKPHPTKPPITDSVELLRQVESKDAKFRIVQSVFSVMVFVVLALLLIGTYRLQTENNQLLTTQGKIIKSQAESGDAVEKSINTKLSDLQSHIDCIVALFQQPNRASLTITNIQECQLSPSSSSGGATGSNKSG